MNTDIGTARSGTRGWTRRIAAGLTAALAATVVTALAATGSATAAPATPSVRSAAPYGGSVTAGSAASRSGGVGTTAATPRSGGAGTTAATPLSGGAGPGPTRTADWPRRLTECSATAYDDDKRLGPARLPRFGPVGVELIGYHRTGTLSPTAFLAQYYDASLYGGTGGWIYPPQNGYRLDASGQPIQWDQELVVGQPIDRFGSEYGAFLSPTGLPYFTRAIPPSNLNSTPAGPCNYHRYRVLKPFSVDAGPIAPWFAQPGGGLQYQLDPTLVPGSPTPLNVLWLVEQGYLKRLP